MRLNFNDKGCDALFLFALISIDNTSGESDLSGKKVVVL